MKPSERALRARLGGLATSASGNGTTVAARAAFERRFYEGIPEGLPKEERDRRAAAARKLYFTRMAYNRERARSKKR